MKKSKIAALILASATALSACGGSTTQETGATTQAVETTEATSEAETEETTVEETTEAETEASEIPMGQMATISCWDITVSQMQILDAVSNGYGQFEPDEGNKYLLISLSAANNGKESAKFLPSFSMSDDITAKLIYGDGYEFDQTNLIGYDRSMLDCVINPLSSAEGDIAFEIPNTVAESTDKMILEFSCGNDKLDFVLR